MPYNPNIPRIDDKLSISQQGFLNNFGPISDWLTVNHVGFNNGADSGNHNVVQALADPANLPAVVNPTEALLYYHAGPVNLNLVPFPVMRNNHPSGKGNVLTDSFIDNPGAQFSEGVFIIGANILVKWGSIGGVGQNAGTYTVPYNPPGSPITVQFLAGSSPLIFLSYYFDPAYAADIEVVYFQTTAISTNVDFQIFKLFDTPLAAFNLSYLAIGTLG